MKIVINTCYGGFGLSEKAYEKLIEWGVPVEKYTEATYKHDGVIFDGELIPKGEDKTHDTFYHDRKPSRFARRYTDNGWVDRERTHPLIVRVVEELGKDAWGECAELAIIDIPDDVQWEISEYDGKEHVAEAHRKWNGVYEYEEGEQCD